MYLSDGYKLHTLLDYDRRLPFYMNMTDGNVHDAMTGKEITLPKDEVVVADRAYLNFETLSRSDKGGSYFVIRLKSSVKFNRLDEKPLPENRHG